LEEDIDDILMRAEVVSQQPGQPGQSVAGGASDLLSSFNVATFKVCVQRCWCIPARLLHAGRSHQCLASPGRDEVGCRPNPNMSVQLFNQP
jgi:hypothetical protein